ncbi:MAG: phosphonate C-P lyase system protein PhnH [Verrucomicrobiota bacterium]
MTTSTQIENQDQQVFRVLLKAMSHPGRAYPLTAEAAIENPLACIMHCLADHEVSFCVPETQSHRTETAEMIFSLTKSRSATIESADYIVLTSAAGLRETIFLARRGTPAYPDSGATIICRIDSEDKGCKHGLELSGPGINPGAEGLPELKGIDKVSWEALAESNTEYPLGVDCIFIDQASLIMCIPRSTLIKFKTSAKGETD